MDELERLLTCCGLHEISLRDRYTIVFVYPGIGAGRSHPELAGCTAQMCAIAEETPRFARDGIQLVAVTSRVEEAIGAAPPPLPVGVIPQGFSSGLIEWVERGACRYALRTSFVVWPDGTGVRIGAVHDPVMHVRRCHALVLEKRLDGYARAIGIGTPAHSGGATATLAIREYLPAGAGSVSIAKVELRSELVCKMADPTVVAEEATYMERINGLLAEEDGPPLFPRVIAVNTRELPGWYLMEAADPRPIAEHVFADAARTELRPGAMHLLSESLARLSTLYQASFRREIPPVSRYHYLERFAAMPARDDFRESFSLLFGEDADLDALLRTSFVLDDGFVCRDYYDQLRFLEANVDELLQPVGAYLHGDVHLPNILFGSGGGTVLIDPRIAWDGQAVADPGFGDPIYDFATLLHSLHHMTAILKAIEDGRTQALLHVGPAGPSDAPGSAKAGPGRVVAVAPGVLHLSGNPAVDWMFDAVERHLPAPLRGCNWQARLHIGAANATLGWLKLARCIATREAWTATLIATLYHLELGRRLLSHLNLRGES